MVRRCGSGCRETESTQPETSETELSFKCGEEDLVVDQAPPTVFLHQLRQRFLTHICAVGSAEGGDCIAVTSQPC